VKKLQHPFKKWLLANHVHEDTTVGDMAREVRLDPGWPSDGGRRDLRRHMEQVWHADGNFLLCFEEAWRLYEPDGSPADHPFVTWLLRQDLRADTPLSTFARDYANIFPAEGERDGLRAVLAASFDPDDPWADWMLTSFDMSWERYEQQALSRRRPRPTVRPCCRSPTARSRHMCGVGSTR
jgi:hypothetical protein